MRVVKAEKIYECPVCKRKFSVLAALINHARWRHGVVLLTGFQSEVYEVCKKLSESKVSGIFRTSEVVKVYRRSYGERRISEIERALRALLKKGLLDCWDVEGGSWWMLKE